MFNKKEIETIENLPFYLKIQQEEFKKQLKQVEEAQKETMERIIQRRHPHLIEEWKDLFAGFMIDFLKGKATSINDFLYVDRLSPVNKRELKKEFENNDD